MKASDLVRNTAVVGALTMGSRVLGLVREMLQSRLIGAGVEQSAFVLAFAIPNMARKLFGEGALTAAFVPVFRWEVERGDEESARRLARAVMTLVMLILGSVVILTVASLTLVLNLQPSTLCLSPRTRLTLQLVRILFPYMIFICGAAFGMGVLNALGRFVAGAFMPAMLNLVWIAALAGLCFFPDLSLRTRVAAVCWAILLGGAAQMLFLFRCMARRGYAFRFRLSGLLDGKARLVWVNTGIAALGAGAIQVNYALDQVLAQCAAPWAAGVIGYAERLMDLPLGVIGVAFGTVLLPTFAGHFAKGDLAGARTVLASALCNMMFVMLPAAAGLCVLAPEVTAVIYEGGSFDATATLRVSRALAVYSVGLGLFGVQKALVPWFQGQNDMKTPLRVSVCTVVANAALNVLAVVLLPQEARHVGLAASTVLCALFGCILLIALGRRRNGSMGLRSVCGYVSRTLLAALAMAGILVLVRPCLAGWSRVPALASLVMLGAGAYALLTLALGVFRLPRRH